MHKHLSSRIVATILAGLFATALLGACTAGTVASSDEQECLQTVDLACVRYVECKAFATLAECKPAITAAYKCASAKVDANSRDLIDSCKRRNSRESCFYFAYSSDSPRPGSGECSVIWGRD